MSLRNNPEETVSPVQLNSELRHAQLELVSAHCATHQLRLRYSAEDLARLGRRDLIRKSAEAASALHEFYRAVCLLIPQGEPKPEQAPAPTPEQVVRAVGWLSDYLRQQRDRYVTLAAPLSGPDRAAMLPYFLPSCLDRVRIIELNGARVAVPDFFAEARGLGFDTLPDIPHMESLTFIEVLAFNEKLSQRALFHALVHVVQIQVLGLDRYAELWVRGFLRTRAHFTVPLEVHAFSLTSRSLRPDAEPFSVEDQVLHWAAADRY